MKRFGTLSARRLSQGILALLGIAFSLLVASVSAEPPKAESEDALDRAFERYWDARSPRRSTSAAKAIREATDDFDAVVKRLERGRTYSADVPRKRVERTRRNRDGVVHPYFFLVPESYDPTRGYPVRCYLHGGISRPAWGRDGAWWQRTERLRSEDHIAVFPASWNESLWWQASQVENLSGILDELKRSYNVDENRIHLFGISDGGSGIYYQALRHATPWASFLPFIGQPAVIVNPANAKGDFHLANLSNRPFFIVNGEVDRLYPAARMQPWVDLMRGAGTQVVFRPKAGAGHDVRWWPEEAARIEAFIAEHPRDPLPPRLDWQAGPDDRFRRIHWLVIDELGEVAGETVFEDTAAGQVVYRQAVGRVEARADGNTIVVRTRGVERYRLLLSPRQFDFRQPVKVMTNGVVSFTGRVEASLETLLRWAARDQDRTMLFAAELEIEVLPAR